MSFILSPNLPQNRVTHVILGSKYKKTAERLNKINISVIHVPDNKDVLPALSGHADLSICHLGGSRLLLSKSTEGFAPELSKYGFDVTVSEKPSDKSYPDDVGLCACILNNYLFHNIKYTDKGLINSALANGIKPLNVKQGYTKCSVCVVDDRHIITEDKSIQKAAEAIGISCLLISPGYIRLDGFDYGFIGGATGKLNKNILAFTGRLSSHPDKQKIYDYLESCGVEPFFLSEEPIYDVGSILPVIESD
jgi:hypothetical protein